jgi:hypothetical protein
MIRRDVILSAWAAALAVAALAAPATAAPSDLDVDVNVSRPSQAANEPISNIIYLNRCTGGCMITASTVSSAVTQESRIPQAPPGTKVTVKEFAWGDQAWSDVVQCVKEIYSPFNVQVTDVDPGASVVHHESIVAGTSEDVGIKLAGGTLLGRADVNPDHTPKNNAISFVFANAFGATNRVTEICATVGQETAHAWGLDHEYDCTDPMTYLPACGGQRFFRNKDSKCGTDAPGECNCDGQCTTSGPTQNSHVRILGVFGPGTSIVPGPTATITAPAAGGTVSDAFSVKLDATGKRGVYKLKLILNGYEWATKDISDDGTHGTAPIYATSFVVSAPTGVPDGVIDVEARACDDLDQCGSAKVTVTKGAPCTDAKTCAMGQKCGDGKCYWDPPSLDVGEVCSYPQQCVSGVCLQNACSQTCFVGVSGQCPSGTTCKTAQSGQGYCLLSDDGGGGGCCSASDDSAAQVASQLGVAGVVVAVGFRRRRRPRR